MKYLSALIAVSLLICSSVCQTARSEVFILVSGGHIEGQLLNPDQSPRKNYRIETKQGGRVTIDGRQVKKVISPDSVEKQSAEKKRPKTESVQGKNPRTAGNLRLSEIEYAKIKGNYSDTIEGQWKLAQWCQERFLSKQRKVHLQRILVLDTNHKQARAALGYSRVDGRWATPDEIMIGRGYRRYKGRWRSPQEIKSIEKKKEREMAKKSWYIKLRRWSGWLGGPKTEQAQKAIAEINDPVATAALANALATDRRRPARLLYIEALFRLNTPAASKTLAMHALENADEETRLNCLDYLKKRKDPGVVAYFIARLGHKNNAMINRAAFALGKMDDTSAVAALIGALVTVHQKTVTSGGAGRTSAGMDNSGGGGMTMGSTTKVFQITFRNREVLDALIALTGGIDFDFDVQAWRYWLAKQNKRKPLNARRD